MMVAVLLMLSCLFTSVGDVKYVIKPLLHPYEKLVFDEGAHAHGTFVWAVCQEKCKVNLRDDTRVIKYCEIDFRTDTTYEDVRVHLMGTNIAIVWSRDHETLKLRIIQFDGCKIGETEVTIASRTKQIDLLVYEDTFDVVYRTMTNQFGRITFDVNGKMLNWHWDWFIDNYGDSVLMYPIALDRRVLMVSLGEMGTQLAIAGSNGLKKLKLLKTIKIDSSRVAFSNVHKTIRVCFLGIVLIHCKEINPYTQTIIREVDIKSEPDSTHLVIYNMVDGHFVAARHMSTYLVALCNGKSGEIFYEDDIKISWCEKPIVRIFKTVHKRYCLAVACASSLTFNVAFNCFLMESY